MSIEGPGDHVTIKVKITVLPHYVEPKLADRSVHPHTREAAKVIF